MPYLKCASCNKRIPRRKSGRPTHHVVGVVGKTLKELLSLDVDGLVCIKCSIRIRASCAKDVAHQRNRDGDHDEESTSAAIKTNVDDKSNDNEVLHTKPEESASTNAAKEDWMEDFEDIFGNDSKKQGT